MQADARELAAAEHGRHPVGALMSDRHDVPGQPPRARDHDQQPCNQGGKQQVAGDPVHSDLVEEWRHVATVPDHPVRALSAGPRAPVARLSP
ncbi:hypothetical protein GCM10027026_11190 [Myroides odoratimimus subsp. xuanwuensis]